MELYATCTGDRVYECIAVVFRFGLRAVTLRTAVLLCQAACGVYFTQRW